MDMKNARDTFLAPPMEHRSQPFWFWNDRLDPEKLVWQYDQMVDGGTGGACLHARSGISADEYLDERWFQAVDAVVARAVERKTKVWLYDELGWPSGSAGGRVFKKHPELCAEHLQMRDFICESEDDLKKDGELMASFVVTKSDITNGFQKRHDGSVSLLPDRIAYEPVDLSDSTADLVGKRLLLFYRSPMPGCLDYLNPDGAQAFLESTYEEYYKRYSEHFGTTITHIFMDEAGMFSRGPGSMPWTGKFADEFEARRGYSLMTKLPDIFFDTKGCEATRYDYWVTATELFREGFGVPLHTWCEAHDIKYTGHYVFETSMKEAIKELGSTMPLYEYQGLPGIDVLGNEMYSARLEIEAYLYYTLMIKQVSSVSNQLSKGGVMSESHGVGGNAMLPVDFQTVHNFQMALGATHIVQHAPFYSIRGKRKLDCPPIIGWQNAYWKFVNKHMDNLGRSGWLLSKGNRRCETLMLHTSSSLQATFRQIRYKEERKSENYLLDADMPFEYVDKQTSILTSDLLDAQIDFEFGDEEIMAKYASVDGSRFRVGDVTYGTVIVPPSLNMRSTTLGLLKAFAEAGGRIVAIGSAPRLLDGKPSRDVTRFLSENAIRICDGVDHGDFSGVVEDLTEMGLRTVTVKTPDGEDVPSMKIQQRTWDDIEVVYLANICREDVETKTSFTVNVDGHIEEWNPDTGATKVVAACTAGEPVELDLAFAARQARILVAVPGAAEVEPEPAYAEKGRVTPEWSGTRNDPGLLLLDECYIRTPEGRSERMVVAQARKWIDANSAKAEAITVEFPFTVAEGGLPADALSVALELGTGQNVTLNGQDVPVKPVGTLFDPAILVIKLPETQPGENLLCISIPVDGETPQALVAGRGFDGTKAGDQIDDQIEEPTQADELESPILLGEFRTSTSDNSAFVLESDDRTVGIGSWPEIGMSFYAGSVTYTAKVTVEEGAAKVCVSLPEMKGAAEVRVNGTVVDQVLWPPYECDITQFVTAGENTVEIEVANTLRNIFGAHYCEDEWRSPGIATTVYQATEPGVPKNFWDFGLLTAPDVVTFTEA